MSGTSPDLPGVFAIRSSGGVIAVLAADEDPRQPPWRRWTMIAGERLDPTPELLSNGILPFLRRPRD